MKEYWFTVYPHCFLWLKGEEGLVYNTKNYAKVRFCREGLLAEKTEQLAVMENLYCIRLTEKELGDEKLNGWIQRMITQECGALVEDNGINQRPLSLPPILKVQDETDYYRWEHRQGIDGNVMENLHRLVFHINGSNHGNELYAKQMLYPTTSSETLSAKEILRFAMNARVSPFLTEIVLVGNPFVYEGLEDLTASLQAICPVSVSCTWQDAMDYSDKVQELAMKTNLNIVVAECTFLAGLSQEASYTFLVTSLQTYDAILECKEKYNLKHVDIVPIYTGNNLSFFEECLYMDEESIQDIAMDKREVFIRQKLSIQDYGRLIVMPDGKVYANLNHSAIGHIGETPHAVVYREMTEGSSWLRIRDRKPCCDCIYQWLCSSPSHYEDVIGKSNLCYIKS